MSDNDNKLLYWAPRVLSIMFIAFLTLFSFDVITPDSTLREIVIGMLMHNIPVFVMIVILIIAWKHEIVGAAAFFLAGLLYIFMVLKGGVPWYMAIGWSMTIAGPAFLIGALFLVCWLKKRMRHAM